MTPAVAICVLGFKYTGALQLLEWTIYDRFFAWRTPEPVEDRLLIITVDEADIAHVGQWPLSDGLLAQIIQSIQQHQPAGIGLLFYRNLPVETGHQALVKVMNSTPNLIGVEKVIGETVPPPPSLNQLNQVGIVDLLLDADSKVRRVLLSHHNSQGELKLSVGAELALRYLKNQGILPTVVEETNYQQQIQLGEVILTPFTGNDGGYVRTFYGGYQILLNYRGEADKFEKVSLTQFIERDFNPDKIQGRIILIGSTATSLNELFYTPYSRQVKDTTKATPGVIIHANVISHMLSAALDGRPSIKVWPDLGESGWILLWSFFGAIAASISLGPNSWEKQLWSDLGQITLNLCLGNSLLISSSYFAFLTGWWLPVVPPAIALTMTSITLKIYQSVQAVRDTEKQLIQSLEALPIGVFLYKASGMIAYINQQGKDLIGLTPKSQMSPAELTHHYQLYVAGTDRHYPVENLPLVRALNGQMTKVDDIESYVNGNKVLFEAQGKPIFDSQGNIIYVLVTFEDITQRKQSEKILADYNQTLEAQIAQRTAALRESEQRFRQAFENSASGMCLVSPEGRFLQVNQAFCKMLGYSSYELLATTLNQITHTEKSETVLKGLEELRSGQGIGIEKSVFFIKQVK